MPAEAFFFIVKSSTCSFMYSSNLDNMRRTYVSKQHNPLVPQSAMSNSIEPEMYYTVFAAIVLGVLSQALINSMLEGDQGLRAFLSDGKGYNKSNFRPSSTRDIKKSTKQADPLPWLKLPSLDFVEVAGQINNEEAIIVKKLETLKLKLQRQPEEGNEDKAKITTSELNALMDRYGFEYKED